MCEFKFWIVDKRTSNKGRPRKVERIIKEEKKESSKRDKEFIKLFRKGKTLQEIGNLYGITRERVRQCLARNGIYRDEGGQHLSAFIRAVEKREKQKSRNNEWIKSLGCTREFRNELAIRSNGNPIKAFVSQKNNSIHRGIEWKLTLNEWWNFWQESGKWEMRGKGSGKYVMGRECDLGAYELGNIKIITHNENARESRQMDKVRKAKKF